jgi:hypothetical protein
MRSSLLSFSALLVALLVSCAAAAKVEQSSPSNANLNYSIPVQASRDAVWKQLIQPQSWWSDSHTWSGKAKNLKLTPGVGNCWCEHWDGNSVEHGRIIVWKPKQGFRMQAVFGPMQEQALSGIMDFRIEEADGKTNLIVAYRLNGSDKSALDKIAPFVDKVMQEQLDRLKQSIESKSKKS